MKNPLQNSEKRLEKFSEPIKTPRLPKEPNGAPETKKKIETTFLIFVNSNVKSAVELEENTQKIPWALKEAIQLPKPPNGALPKLKLEQFFLIYVTSVFILGGLWSSIWLFRELWGLPKSSRNFLVLFFELCGKF